MTIENPYLRAAIAVAVMVAAPSLAMAGGSTADHGKFEALDRDFASGPEVTRACLACHTEAAKQVHGTTHWTWDFVNPKTGQRLGKKNVINNFCISAMPNIAECSSCHVGYGWKDETFDFSSEENVDCLVCHDTTGTYSKKALRTTGARKPNLKKMAQGVGPTNRRSCGACHFSGGGGKAVKHGDIDPSLEHPDVFVDVHMDADGLNFTCATCHGAENHAVTGSRYAAAASDSHGIDVPGRDDGSRATCQSCHGDAPMKDEKLNQHTDTVASFEKILKVAPESVLMLDVRDPSEFETGHFKPAVNMTVDEVEEGVAELPKGKPIVFVCSTGTRSAEAFDIVKMERNDVEVYFLDANVEFATGGSYTITPNVH